MQFHAKQYSLALAMVVVAAPLATKAAIPDMTLAGLHFGMTMNQVQSTLGPKYHLETRTGDDPGLIVAAGTTEDKTDALILSYADGRLWYIKHDVDFPSGKEPTVDGLKKQLISKFGPIRGVQMSYYTWVYTPSGSLVNDKDGFVQGALNPCISVEEQYPDIAARSAEMGRVQANFSSSCGTAASAAWGTAETNRGLVAHVKVIVSDESYMYKYLSDKSHREEQKRQEDLQKANKNAAPL